MEVENHPKWKETNIGDTPLFRWTMIMGGRVNFRLPQVQHQIYPNSPQKHNPSIETFGEMGTMDYDGMGVGC